MNFLQTKIGRSSQVKWESAHQKSDFKGRLRTVQWTSTDHVVLCIDRFGNIRVCGHRLAGKRLWKNTLGVNVFLKFWIHPFQGAWPWHMTFMTLNLLISRVGIKPTPHSFPSAVDGTVSKPQKGLSRWPLSLLTFAQDGKCYNGIKFLIVLIATMLFHILKSNMLKGG